jgi:mono/diheme cytochrome c family protein
MDSSGNTHYWRPGMDNLELYKHPAWASSPPVGGQYAEVMARRLKASDPSVALHEKKLLQQLPPPLIREGQKVQARWLMSFLREPHEIRPQVAQHLRMPTFNLTDEEIQALVDYFVAVDRLENAALGTEYTVPDFPSRDPRVQQEQRQALRSMVAPITGRTADPEADYYEYGWRFITNKSNCLSCHNVGKLQSEGKAEEKGPNLDSAPQRLRPEYIVHWVSRPSRILPYTMMKDHPEFLADRPALPPDKLAAFYREGNKLAEAGKWYFPLDRGLVYSYIVENALTPQQRTRAVRDALMTWGYLAQPPPSAQKVGPPEPVKRH